VPNRRAFVRTLSQLPLIGGLLPHAAHAATVTTRDYFKDLGVRTFINAAGTFTTLTASLMPQEVMDAMQYASKQYVGLIELHDAVAARLASLIGVEAAMVTSGAAGALTCGTAACITGKDPKKILQIPDLTGLKSEVIIQKAHRYGYDHAVRTCGVRMIEVETPEEVDRVAGEKTAMMLFFNDAEPKGRIPAAEWVRLGKKHGIPTFNDAAADVPPVERFSKYNNMGFDLVAFSGGKALRGPQSSGLLLGRKDLIEAARLNTSPYSDTIARGMKVNKEEMLGLLVAVELFLKRDHDAEWKEWERRANVVAAAAKKVPGVTAEIFVPPIANHAPHLRLQWDRSKLQITPSAVMKQLRAGQPSIEASPLTDENALIVGVWMMQPGDAEVVGPRIAAALRSA
jgi:D-glucosaminate-6-phosphate ammonia-lyase